MNDDEIWELARKPVTEFIEAIKEIKLNVDRLVEFYQKHTKCDQMQAQIGSHLGKEVPMEDDKLEGEEILLSPLARAKLQLAIVYAINASYWMYLVAEGEDPEKNEISKDIERIRLFMNRAKEVERTATEPCSSAKRPKFYVQPLKSSDGW